jgi:hypothetical protein
MDDDRPVQWVSEPWQATKFYRCPCCGFKTLCGRGYFELCPVCYWEDDGQDEPDKDRALGGPNKVSLSTARENFKRLGAMEERLRRHVRPPTPDEI